MRYSRWDQPIQQDDGYGLLKSLALRHFEAAGVEGEPFARHLRDDDLRALVQLDLDYASLSPSKARHLRQGLAFFQKRKDLDLGFDRRAEAVRKFKLAEELCAQTNRRFRLRRSGVYDLDPRTERILAYAARKIALTLGEVPSVSELHLKFGPGATTQIPKRMASARAKLGTVPACSSELAPALTSVWDALPTWAQTLKDVGPLPVVIHPGKVVFVPKNAKEDRSVMVEPSLNTLFQGGIGSYMAERLRRVGIDIRDQTANQRAALRGSLDGSLATIDLSSASDTVAKELVFDLLPPDWYFLLARFRTGTALFEGATITLEKFSSMGNGFTFPLETLIFYALTYGVCRELGISHKEVLAYGDDIICPTDAAPVLNEVLLSCGFLPNKEKSFSEGPFRESCGADYLNGIDIRPVYIKDRLLVSDLFRLHNHYWREFDYEATASILEFIDPSIRIYGPDGYGDGHLLGEWVPTIKKSFLKRGLGGAVFDTFTWKPKRSFRTYFGDRVLPAYSIYLRESASYEYWKAAYEPASPDASTSSEGLSVGIPGKLGVRRISVYTFRR